MTPAQRLTAFLAATDSPRPEDVALRTLTLHMLEHVAPTLYAAQHAGPTHLDALQRCARVDYGLDRALDADRLQAGLDAWLCRHLKDLPHAPPDPFALRTALRWLADDDQLIYAWLLGELAARCGIDVRLPVEPRPFRGASRVHDAYYLTHLVMLDTDYFARRLSHPDAASWGDELLALVPWLERRPNLDLAGEVVLCLRVMKRDTAAARALLDGAGLPEDPHTMATVLLALSAE